MNLKELEDLYGKLSEYDGNLKTHNSLIVKGVLYIKYKTKNKYLAVICEVCRKDPELYGEGYFGILEMDIKSGCLPCGCSACPKFTEAQFKVRVRREAERRGYEFKGWNGEYKKSLTKIVLLHPQYGVWDTANINSFLTKNIDHPEVKRFKGQQLIPENIYTDRFRSTGFYPDTTTFSRSEVKASSGSRLWEVFCAECEITSLMGSYNIERGQKYCECQNKAKYTYMHPIYLDGSVIGVKYGISVNPKERFRALKRHCSFVLEFGKVWEFEDYRDCRKAENLCKMEIPQLLSQEEMTDGWTETASALYIEKIENIFSKLGGSRVS